MPRYHVRLIQYYYVSDVEADTPEAAAAQALGQVWQEPTLQLLDLYGDGDEIDYVCDAITGEHVIG